MIKLDCLLLLYAMFTAAEFSLLCSMTMPREQLACPYLLTKVFTHYEIDLSSEASFDKESFGSATINRTFLPRNDFNKIANGEPEEEEDARLKKHHHRQIPGGKRKKIDIEEKEAENISSGSEGEPSGRVKMPKKKINKLKKEHIGLKDSFNKFKRSVKEDLSEIKWNLRRLFKKLGRKYTKKVSSLSISEDISSTKGSNDGSDVGSDKAQENTLGKSKRPFIHSSAKKAFIVL